MHGKKSAILALAAVIITVAAVWVGSKEAVPRQATWEDVLAEARAGGYQIIRTEALFDLYRDKVANPLLVDTRQEWEYRTGHIAGAQNMPMEPTWWARWRKAGDLEAMLGPDRQRDVVFY